ncbi:MAG: ornithine cyclodeaminase family protein [Chloroflexota bacterium]|nr:ornithine cyclodeaminase family protein [Chloroflexota bacterium]
MGNVEVPKTLILTAEDVSGLLCMSDVIRVVESAFRAYGKPGVEMPPKSYLKVEKGDFRAMPASMGRVASIKWVNVHPGNRDRNLPTVMGVLVYSDAETGYPLALMDATAITAYRTGATAAIASKYLARRGSRTLGLLGTGRQAHTQLLAHAELFDFEIVRAYDVRAGAAESFVETYPDRCLVVCTLEEVLSSDIVCTLTTAKEPLVRREWVKSGAHINAVGADAEGKQELDPRLLVDALVVVDDLRQAAAAGEINVPLSNGLFKLEQVHATLSEVVNGDKAGRQTDGQITVFDSTGIAIEDLATASLVYDRAREEAVGTAIELVKIR